MANQRSTRNYLKTSRLSGGYLRHVLLGGVAFIAVLLIFVWRTLNEIKQLVATLPDPQLAHALNERLATVMLVTMISATAFIVFTAIYTLVLGQRVGGPIVAICDYIRDIRAGNYDFTRSLRKNDELGPIMKELRELARELAARRDV